MQKRLPHPEGVGAVSVSSRAPSLCHLMTERGFSLVFLSKAALACINGAMFLRPSDCKSTAFICRSPHVLKIEAMHWSAGYLVRSTRACLNVKTPLSYFCKPRSLGCAPGCGLKGILAVSSWAGSWGLDDMLCALLAALQGIGPV